MVNNYSLDSHERDRISTLGWIKWLSNFGTVLLSIILFQIAVHEKKSTSNSGKSQWLTWHRLDWQVQFLDHTNIANNRDLQAVATANGKSY